MATTDEIRQFWSESGEGFTSTEELCEEFDRWLTGVKAEAYEEAAVIAEAVGYNDGGVAAYNIRQAAKRLSPGAEEDR